MSTVLLKPESIYRVGKIVCIGQNYLRHIDELSSKRSDTPVLFFKPSTSLLTEAYPIRLPDFSDEVHHEVELALLVGKLAKSISTDDWREYIVGAGIALDLTLRDLQSIAKERGLPWAVAKGFDGSCPVSEFISIDKIKNIQNLTIELRINGTLKQHGSTSEMIYPVGELLAYITKIFTLEPGDIVLTGTPAGVGKIKAGDRLEASITEIGSVVFEVS